MPLPESNLVMYVAGGAGGGGGSSRPPIVVDALPEIGRYGVTYLVPNGGTPPNVYDEYIWVSAEAGYELLGQKEVDLSHYVRDTRTVNGHPLSANVEVTYADLQDKPSIEGVTLTGNKTAADLGLVPDTRKVGNVPLSSDIPVTLTGDSAITVINTGTASAIGYSVAHNDSGVTAGSKGDTTNQTPGFGETFKTLSVTVDAKGHVTALSERNVKIPDTKVTTSMDGLMSKEDKVKLDEYASKGSATKGVYIDASGSPQSMTHELNADVPANFAPATAAPLIDGTAAVGTSARYAREDHEHPTDTSRASADDVTAQGNRITALETENVLLRELVNGIDAPIYRTASGNPATFSDGYPANVKALSVEITPTQEGEGDPYPPGGGKNLLSPIPNNSSTHNGITFTPKRDAGGNLLYVTANGTLTANNASLQLTSNNANHSDWSGMVLSGAGQSNSEITIQRGAPPWDTLVRQSVTPVTIPAISDDLKVAIYLIVRGSVGDVINNVSFYPMIRRASDTDPTFAPYSNIRPISGVTSVTVTRTGENGTNAQTVTVQLTDGSNPLTVYGGTLDVTTGELAVTYSLIHIDGNTPFLGMSSNGGPTIAIPRRSSDDLRLGVCSMFPVHGVTGWRDYRPNYLNIPYGNSGIALAQALLVIDGLSTADEYHAWLAEHEFDYVAPLATPVAYQLAPAQLATLSGYNAVSSDAGTLSVTYRADPSITLGG